MKKILLISLLSISFNSCRDNSGNYPNRNNLINDPIAISTSPISSPSLLSSSVPLSNISDTKEKILFMSNRTGFWDIYAMNTDGTKQIRITHDNMKGPFAFSVSPDNKKLAYISDKTGNSELYVKDLITGKVVQLTETSADEGNPSWSSDSLSIIFHSNYFNKEKYEILKINSPFTSINSFTKFLSDDFLTLLHPSYSPNGAYILYAEVNEEGKSVLKVHDNIQKKDFEVVSSADNPINGSWSIDSKKIIYWTSNNGIFEINIDGSSKRQINSFKNIRGTPFFSPDGKKIAIARGVGFPEDYNIWIIDSDGSNPKKLTNEGGISISWIKDSTGLNLTSNNNNPISDISASPSSSSDSQINPLDPSINPN